MCLFFGLDFDYCMSFAIWLFFCGQAFLLSWVVVLLRFMSSQNPADSFSVKAAPQSMCEPTSRLTLDKSLFTTIASVVVVVVVVAVVVVVVVAVVVVVVVIVVVLVVVGSR